MSTLKDTVLGIKRGEVSSETLVRESLERMGAANDLNIFLSDFGESALERARGIDKRRAAGESLGALAGVPLAIKDNIVIAEGRTTCASRMLEEFRSPYSATAAQRLLDQDAVFVGKTNMDEFAMGSSNENSAFGAVRNPLDPDCVPGGSSGGSAAAVAAGLVPASLGSDTGGSIRQPAACCGVVGLKPTYGRISRYGLVAFASSLDQIGPITNNVADSAYLLNLLCGHDPADNTSALAEVPDFSATLDQGVKGKVIGVPREYFGEGLDADVKQAVERTLSGLEKEGATLREISLPHMEYGVAAYYIIACAEASANLARFDGVRYTRRAEDARDLFEVYSRTRGRYFGAEVKKRIILGTYVLSSGFYDAYYLQAQKVRRVITRDFEKAFVDCDAIATPTMPSWPWKIGEKSADPLAMYLEDVYTVSVNLAGLPGISIPVGRKGNLRTGFQLIGKAFGEQDLLRIAAVAEAVAMG